MPSFWKSNRASKSHSFFPDQQQQQHPGKQAVVSSLPAIPASGTEDISLHIKGEDTATPLLRRVCAPRSLEQAASASKHSLTGCDHHP